MENELAPRTVEGTKNQTPLSLAIILSLSAFVMAFCAMFYENHGVLFSTVLFDHPAAFSEYLAGAFGGSLLLPLIHVGVASAFQKKRNESSRRNIFIGWSVAIIIIQLSTILAPI